MTVTVVETVSKTNQFVNPASIAITTTPQAGDVLVFETFVATHSTGIINLTGCGATWTKVAENVASSQPGHLVWIGTGATSAGTITATYSDGRQVSLRALVIRGLSSAATATTTDFSSAGISVPVLTPDLPAGLGQIVLGMGSAPNAASLTTFPANPAPTAGWDAGLALTGQHSTTYRVPGSTATHHFGATPNSNGTTRVTQVVLGDSGAPPPVVETTLATGVQVGLAFEATSVQPAQPTTLETGLEVGLTFDALTVVETTLETPVNVGLGFDASQPGVYQTTLTTPVAVGLDFAATSAETNVLPGWDADVSQRTLLDLQTAVAELIVDPPLAPPPAGIVERPLQRHSITLDPAALTPDAQGRVRAPADSYTTTTGVVGTLHVIIDGRDVTYWRGAPTLIGQTVAQQPFGDVSATITLPQITPLDTPGAGDLAWLRNEAPVELVMKRDDGSVSRLWAGHLISDDSGNDETAPDNTWSCHGTLYQASYQGHRVPIVMDPTDLGTVIPKSLNGVVSRRYPAIPQVSTGILTRQRGSYTDSELAYSQNLLATAWTTGGLQWTVAKRPGTDRSYALALKDRSTVDWTVTVGAPGVTTRLSRDGTQVVRAIYGRGVASDGYSWAGWCWPSLLSDDAPAFPFNDPDRSIHVGDTDATTDSGDGVTTWQRRAVELGHNLTVDGTFDQADSDVARAIQRGYGLLVDGVVGPQTWAATFAVGSNGGDLMGAYRRPLAIDTRVDPNLYTANGAVTGPNPAYDSTVLRLEREIDYGPGVTKTEATRSAQIEIDRDADPALTGSITLLTDPREGSRFDIAPGHNIEVLGWDGSSVLLHVVGVTIDWQNLTVSLDVDEHARDALTLSQIRSRNRDSRPDPARRPGNVNRRSRQAQDQVVEYDGESGAGVIPRHAIRQGLWTVIYIPVSQVGRAAKIEIQSSGPTAKFAIALFASPVTPAHLLSLVGDPLSGENPFARDAAKARALDDLGLIEAFGGPGSAAGYWPGQEGNSALTGKLLDTGGFEYVSNEGGWVWVAEYSPVSTFLEGRVYPAPMSS